MPAKRATAKQSREDARKEDACRVLQVAPSADEELITQAYWHQARKVRAYARTDPNARKRLDELNEAYRVLNPGQPEAPLEREAPAAEQQGVSAAMTQWLRGVAQETAWRWPGRATEVAILIGTTAVLAALALNAGADVLYTLGAAAIAAVTIWAPWRRS